MAKKPGFKHLRRCRIYACSNHPFFRCREALEKWAWSCGRVRDTYAFEWRASYQAHKIQNILMFVYHHIPSYHQHTLDVYTLIHMIPLYRPIPVYTGLCNSILLVTSAVSNGANVAFRFPWVQRLRDPQRTPAADFIVWRGLRGPRHLQQLAVERLGLLRGFEDGPSLASPCWAGPCAPWVVGIM